MVDGGMGWCKEGRLSSLFKPRVPGVIVFQTRHTGQEVPRQLVDGLDGRDVLRRWSLFNFPFLDDIASLVLSFFRE